MGACRLITLAIHTYEKALALKTILEREGVVAVLNNVNLANPSISSGVRVRISESDLPLALRIVENPDVFKSNDQHSEELKTIIVPIDFSDYSYRACLVAFNIAKLHKAQLSIIYSYIGNYSIDNLRFNEDYHQENEEANKNKINAKERMSQFSNKLIEQIKFGVIPPIRFTTTILEGVPEDSITEFAKQNKPLAIIMGTRGAGKKEKELVGSVTGEVLDSCRFPVLAVPELVSSFEISRLKHLVFFCNFDNKDIIALDMLYRLLPNISLDITMVNIPNQTTKLVDPFFKQKSEILKYCSNNYPRFNFKVNTLDIKDINKEFEFIKETPIDLIIIPNKKKNVFARFFNPSLAHKILLHSDIPMMTIPI